MSVGGAWTRGTTARSGCNSDSSNNRALVTGGGSTWNCADNMYVGLNGPANSLVISNGGRIINTDGSVGSNPGSDGNSALVTGAGSVWTNNGDLYVGYFASGNGLTIRNGGRVVNNYGYVGRSRAAKTTACWWPVPGRSGPTISICMSATSVRATAWLSPTAAGWTMTGARSDMTPTAFTIRRWPLVPGQCGAIIR